MKTIYELNIELLAHPIAYGIFTILLWELSKQLFKAVYFGLKK